MSLCRNVDTLVALHVFSESVSAEAVVEYYQGECDKAKYLGHASNDSMMRTTAVTKGDMAQGGLSGAILRLAADADVLVMGSIELKKAKNRHVLGSLAVAIAKDRQAPHLFVVKNYT